MRSAANRNGMLQTMIQAMQIQWFESNVTESPLGMWWLLIFLAVSPYCGAQALPVEPHHRIASLVPSEKRVALTLDACSGKFDAALIEFLIRNQIPATLFVTKRWLDRNPYGASVIKANLSLFNVEDHGENHIPAVIGEGREVYGIAGFVDVAHLRKEVVEGARAIQSVMGVTPQWYRGATAVYDPQAIKEINRLGFKVAGFSVNADSGATLSHKAIVQRLQRVKSGDVIIAHMKKPASDTAKGLAEGLLELLRAGYVFVRLDQVELEELPKR
jgi:peptidoglycan/xylan/chitin deacetylase (PgdA/CDA1 family)